MIIRRARPTRNFTTLDNQVICDPNVTDALGLLLYLLSRPPDWMVQQQDCMTRFACGRDRIQSWMRQLVDAGYATLGPLRNPDGSLAGRGYTIRDEPCIGRIPSEDGDAAGDGDDAENPHGESEGDGGDPAPNSMPADDDCEPYRQPENPPLGEPHRQPGFPIVGKPGFHIQRTDSNKILPLNPQTEAAAAGDFRGSSGSIEELPADIAAEFEQFRRLWPSWGERDLVAPAQRAFAKLSTADRKAAIANVERFVATRDLRDGKRVTGSARHYFRDRRWEGLSKPGDAPRQVFVAVGTPAWDAWTVIWRKLKGVGPPDFAKGLQDGKRANGWLFDRYWPDDTDYAKAGLPVPPSKAAPPQEAEDVQL